MVGGGVICFGYRLVIEAARISTCLALLVRPRLPQVRVG